MRSLLCLLSLIALPAPGPAFAGGLNDSGIDFCSDENTDSSNCNTVFVDGGTHPGQDARYGRDAAAAAGKLPKVGGGGAGFDFTGLVWEVKTTDGDLRDQQWTYTWYDSVHNYGGNAGTASGGTCKTAGRCDTEKYVADVNASALCGFSDWRMPSVDELQGIVHYGRSNPSIEPSYFRNTLSWVFWSASLYAPYPANAWVVYFFNGNTNAYVQSGDYHVRLVRSGQ
ncbi:DUF1566 domain-containing protein [bacterium]|nr:DUF1566 domain-containing protein [bacterium]